MSFETLIVLLVVFYFNGILHGALAGLLIRRHGKDGF